LVNHQVSTLAYDGGVDCHPQREREVAFLPAARLTVNHWRHLPVVPLRRAA
jgi:hypothetical protein